MTVGSGNCGCGYLGTCWTHAECGCTWDHGDFRPCAAHEKDPAETPVAEPA